MPFGKLLLRPGIETRLSQAANSGGWSVSQLMRWLGGLPQKIGGWVRITSTALVGVCRTLHAWADLSGISYLAAGTSERLEVLLGGHLYDITPLRATDNVAVDFSTVINTATVTIVDVANGSSVGDWVNILVPVSVGGLIIQGLYQVQTVVSANAYTITAASNATATVNNGGAVPLFATTNTFATVSVTLANHGYSTGSLFDVQVSTTVATVVIFGSYNVTSVTNANVFVITASSAATGTTTGAENGGNARFEYLIPSGLDSNTPVSGYGIGLYGAGFYGMGSGTAFSPMRIWSLDNWGALLLATYNGSPVYVWSDNVDDPAVVVPTAPSVNTSSFVIAPVQIFVLLGSTTTVLGSTQDPNLVRWSDITDYTNFTPDATNQAGSFRIPSGSKLMGGLMTAQQAVLFTDVDVWSMTYQNLPFVFGFNRLGNECGLVGQNAASIIGGNVYWMSHLNFYTLSAGAPKVVQCTVWDQVFGNISSTQIQKTITAVNSHFNEITWYYQSANGTEVDSYVKLNVVENLWDYGTLVRTAWSPASVLGFPTGVDAAGLLQQHEVGNDNDGSPIIWFAETGYIDIMVGEDFSFVDQFYPDTSSSSTRGGILEVTLKTTKFADDVPTIDGPYQAPIPTDMLSVRARGRQMAVRFGSSDLGSFIRLGGIRYRYADDGAN